MPKTRLNKEHRRMLVDLAYQKIEKSFDFSKLNSLYAEFRTKCLVEVANQFPPKDMRILAKYGAAQMRNNVGIVFYSKDSDEKAVADVIFENDRAHITNYYSAEAKLKLPYGGEIYQLYLRWKEEKNKTTKRLNKIRGDYQNLINYARTFEDVLEVWEEAEELRHKICANRQLIVMNNELCNRIKQNVKERKEG